MSIFYYLPALIGIVFIIVGTYHGWKLRRLVGRCKAAATGTLLGFEQQKSKSGDRYFPVVEFSDGGAVAHIVEEDRTLHCLGVAIEDGEEVGEQLPVGIDLPQRVQSGTAERAGDIDKVRVVLEDCR